MGLPAKQRTRTSKRDRASHFALKKATFGICEKCKEPIRPHHACANCGTYKGKSAINVEKRVVRKSRKRGA